MLSHRELLREAVGLTRELVKIRSINPPGDELPVAQLLADWMEKHGFEVAVQTIGGNRGNVIGIIRGSGEAPSLVFCGHLDVVPPGDLGNWSYDPFSAEVVGNRIYGRGTADMKGGLAAMAVSGALLIREKVELKGDLIVAGVAGEEVDSIGAKFFAESKWFENCGGIVIGEPTGMELVTAHRGALWVKIKTYGKSAHGSTPHLGINAIIHTAEVIKELTKYQFKYEPVELLEPPTMNIGTIRGGVKTNIVPDTCEITVDIRTLPTQEHGEIVGDLEEMIRYLSRRIPAFKAEIEVINDRKPVITDPESPLVLKAIEAGREALGRELKPRGATYYTDASEFTRHPKCPPIIIIGPGKPELAHKPDEYVEIDSLEEAVKFYNGLAKKVLT